MGSTPWHVAFLCTADALEWQWLVVVGYFQGHWSGLFFTGDRFTQSPAVRTESTYPVTRESCCQS